VYFVGFTPGLPYMAGQPAQLTIPRLDRPRVKTPAGSVAIGGTQTSIYSVESPGGFWLLGRTPVRLYDPEASDPILLRAGDRIRFRPIEPGEFEAIAAQIAAGAYRPRIEDEA
jgi:inhibitor of KinA